MSPFIRQSQNDKAIMNKEQISDCQVLEVQGEFDY